MGLWGCHSNPSEEKREGGDVALGHPHPSCSLFDGSHHTGDLPGRLTTQWADQRRAFTGTISRLQSLCVEPPAPPNSPFAIPPPHSPSFLSRSSPSLSYCCPVSVVLVWDGMRVPLVIITTQNQLGFQRSVCLWSTTLGLWLINQLYLACATQ